MPDTIMFIYSSSEIGIRSEISGSITKIGIFLEMRYSIFFRMILHRCVRLRVPMFGSLIRSVAQCRKAT